MSATEAIQHVCCSPSIGRHDLLTAAHGANLLNSTSAAHEDASTGRTGRLHDLLHSFCGLMEAAIKADSEAVFTEGGMAPRLLLTSCLRHVLFLVSPA